MDLRRNRIFHFWRKYFALVHSGQKIFRCPFLWCQLVDFQGKPEPLHGRAYSQKIRWKIFRNSHENLIIKKDKKYHKILFTIYCCCWTNMENNKHVASDNKNKHLENGQNIMKKFHFQFKMEFGYLATINCVSICFFWNRQKVSRKVTK